MDSIFRDAVGRRPTDPAASCFLPTMYSVFQQKCLLMKRLSKSVDKRGRGGLANVSSGSTTLTLISRLFSRMPIRVDLGFFGALWIPVVSLFAPLATMWHQRNVRREGWALTAHGRAFRRPTSHPLHSTGTQSATQRSTIVRARRSLHHCLWAFQ
jgi:hypothetical protein